MRAVFAVLLSVLAFCIQAALVFIAFLAVAAVGIKAGGVASWVYFAFAVGSALLASGAGGYMAVRVPRSAFQDVRAVVIYVGFTTIYLVYCALIAFSAFYLPRAAVFGNASQLVFFVATGACALFGARLGYLHEGDGQLSDG